MLINASIWRITEKHTRSGIGRKAKSCSSLKNHHHGDDKILKWVGGSCSI